MPYCSNCGEMVTPAFARVFGDNDGTIHGCVHCPSAHDRSGVADRKLDLTSGPFDQQFPP